MSLLELLIAAKNNFEGTLLSPNTSMFNLSPTNLFANMDRTEPDRSEGDVRRDVIGQPDKDGIGRRDYDDPGLGQRRKKRKKLNSKLALRQLK